MFLAAPFAFLAALALVWIYARGMSDCAEFDAGNRAGSLLYVAPVTVALWAAFSIPTLMGAVGRHAKVGFLVGLVGALIVAYSFLAQVPAEARELGAPWMYCTNGVPNDWPWFLPH